MKKVKLMLVAVVAVLLLGMSSVNAQEQSTEMVIIRITETSLRGGSWISTTDIYGKTSTIDLESNWNIKTSTNNEVLIQKELKKWKQEGYKITNLSTSGDAIFRTTIILEK